MKIQRTDAELTQLLGHAGGWARGMISRDFEYVSADNRTGRGRPNAVESDRDKKLVHDYVMRQSENNPVTIADATEFIHKMESEVDRFWVYRFQKRSSETFTMHTVQL
jgi:hypothetical protein